jgi:hypothetical protein
MREADANGTRRLSPAQGVRSEAHTAEREELNAAELMKYRANARGRRAETMSFSMPLVPLRLLGGGREQSWRIICSTSEHLRMLSIPDGVCASRSPTGLMRGYVACRQAEHGSLQNSDRDARL